MRTISFKYIFLLAVTVCLVACEKKVNDWEIDPDHDRLFKPLVFEMVEAGATYVNIRYTQSVSSDRYIFEFSKDSLQFGSISKRVEILADTLTPFSESTSPMRTEYRTTFHDLDGSTGYSVRMKCLDTTTGKESAFSQFYFKTGAEQIFTNSITYTDRIQVYWTPTDRVTHITVANGVTHEVLQNKTLTTSEKSNATAVLDNLLPGTNYIITIYNNDTPRGIKTLKTTGIQNGILLTVNPGDDIAALISSAVAQGKTSISLLFNAGQTYNLGSVTLPSGVTNLSLTGNPAQDGTLPILNLQEFKLSDLIYGQVLFQNLELAGDISKYFINIGTNNMQIGEFSFKNCKIASYRSVVRLANNSMDVNKISFDDCLVNNIGGYGVVNVAGSSASVDSILIKNSTLTELSTQLMDVRTNVSYIYIGNCTFCNLSSSLTQFLRLDTAHLPSSIVTELNIIAGNNGGAKINAVNFDISKYSLAVSFAGSYRTNDLTINSYEFSSITLFEHPTSDLFVDPVSKNFRIKSGSGFGGQGTAGDPRWFD